MLQHRKWVSLFVLSVMVALGFSAQATVAVPNVISSNMVLQRSKPIAIWGTANAGENVSVSIEGSTEATQADANGKWKVALPSMSAGGPFTLTIKGAENTLTLENVLVGEVWICSGQSNMQWPLHLANNPEQEIAAANYPNMRLFTVPNIVADKPQDNCPGEWKACTPESAKDFTAVGYFFGRMLHTELDVPVGLINTSWGGTAAEAWTSREYLEKTPNMKPILERWDDIVVKYPEAKAAYDVQLAEWQKAADAAKAAGTEAPKRPGGPQGPESPNRPANLYNAMIAPLVPYTVQGAIWYQGESNASRAYQYRELFPLMIQNWRDVWNQQDQSFYFVQLANFMERKPEPGDSAWAELREAQTMTLSMPATGMATIIDIGDAKDIHPRNKQDVGKRLALWALKKDYGKKVEFSGPMYKSMKVKDGKAILTMTHAKGMAANGGGELKGFSIAGADKKFVWAKAEIKGKKIIVSSDQVAEPVSVRYAWSDNPECNLVNGDGLPASPFRTDEWPGVTVDAK